MKTGRFALQRAGGVVSDPAGAAEAKLTRAVDRPDVESSGLIERFVFLQQAVFRGCC
jgi:hypothetical protein